jgi:hypothetical protein
MRKALIFIIAVFSFSLVYRGLDFLLPPKILGFSSFVIANPAAFFALWLCLYPILGADKPFKRHVVAGVVGVLFGLIVAIAMDKLL